MFQSIKYLNCTYDNKTQLYTYHYELVDSEFTTQVAAVAVAALRKAAAVAAVRKAAAVAVAVAVAAEYERRKTPHQDIIQNLFLLNMFILKQSWGYKDLNQILEYQHKYLTKEYYPESNFREKYYDDLVKYTKKMMIIS